MKRKILIACLAAMLSAPTHASPTIAMSAVLKRDVQCFVLFAVAVDGAEASKDEQLMQAGTLGMMYFLGKIKVSAPDLYFVEAVREIANAMDAAPPAEELGKDCDAELQMRGSEMMELGRQLQQGSPHSSSSS